jgi:F-type H+-transporting ATPase subunit delta
VAGAWSDATKRAKNPLPPRLAPRRSDVIEGARFRGQVGAPDEAKRAVSPEFPGFRARTSDRDKAALAEQNSVLTQIARPYAAALFDLAKSEGALEAVETGLVEIKKLSAESADFRRFLGSPVIGAEAKAEAVDAILSKATINPTVSNFVKVIARNGRLFALDATIDAFLALAAKERGEVAAEVTSATPLSGGQLKSLADTLKQKIGKTVTLTEHVDPSLIGGLVVKVGSQMIDSSLKTKLQAMKIAMKEVG